MKNIQSNQLHKHLIKYSIYFIALNIVFTIADDSSSKQIPLSVIRRETVTTKELDNRKRKTASHKYAAVGKKRISGPAQTIGLTFIAASVEDAQVDSRPQPNCNGWVGPEQYIVITNQHLRSFNKQTGKPDGILDIDTASFFGVPCVDVRINFDRLSQRWFMSCEFNNVATGAAINIILAVSSGSVITKDTRWDIYTIPNALVNPSSPTGSIDYQQLAVSENAVFINVGTFQDVSEMVFTGTSVIVIEKKSLLAGSPLITVFPHLLPGMGDFPQVGGYEEFIVPADNFDRAPQFGYMISSANFIPPNANVYNKFYFYRIENPGSATPKLGKLIVLPAPDYADPAFAPHKGNVFGSVGLLQTFLGAFAAAHVRDHQLYLVKDTQMNSAGKVTATADPAGDRVGLQWFRYDLTGDPTGKGQGIETATTIPVLIQSGTVFDNALTNPKFYFSPSIMTNKYHDMVISGTVSGADDYINVFYVGRKSTDPLNTLKAPVLVTNNTSLPFNYAPNNSLAPGPNVQRWGDLGSLSPDPVEDLDIWLTNESVMPNGWGVTVAQLKPAP